MFIMFRIDYRIQRYLITQDIALIYIEISGQTPEEILAG